MTTYRCVCCVCSAYIRSEPIRTGLEQAGWQVQCGEWLDAHFCGDGREDGIESPGQYSQATGVCPGPTGTEATP